MGSNPLAYDVFLAKLGRVVMMSLKLDLLMKEIQHGFPSKENTEFMVFALPPLGSGSESKCGFCYRHQDAHWNLELCAPFSIGCSLSVMGISSVCHQHDHGHVWVKKNK